MIFHKKVSTFFLSFLLCAVGWNFWNDHVLGWWKQKDDPNVLFLKYEDLHKVILQFRVKNNLWLVQGASINFFVQKSDIFLCFMPVTYVLLHLPTLFKKALDDPVFLSQKCIELEIIFESKGELSELYMSVNYGLNGNLKQCNLHSS